MLALVHLPIHKAADKLGMKSTAFKKLCRTHHIGRWPHRQYKSLASLSSHMQAQVKPAVTADILVAAHFSVCMDVIVALLCFRAECIVTQMLALMLGHAVRRAAHWWTLLKMARRPFSVVVKRLNASSPHRHPFALLDNMCIGADIQMPKHHRLINGGGGKTSI